MFEAGTTSGSTTASPSQALFKYHPTNTRPSVWGSSGGMSASPASAETSPMAPPPKASKRTVTLSVQAAVKNSVPKSTSAAANREAETASSIFLNIRILYLLKREIACILPRTICG